MSGWLLSAAALLFWLAWALMPGVGVTDPAQIFALVSSQRPLVAVSVLLQLISAALYAPALVGMTSATTGESSRLLRWGASLLLIGAMGSAADAVLLLLAPMILSFFVGGALIALALVRGRAVTAWNLRLHGLAVPAAAAGGAMAASGLVPARAVGLTVLGLIALAQMWSGVAVSRPPQPRLTAPAAIP